MGSIRGGGGRTMAFPGFSDRVGMDEPFVPTPGGDIGFVIRLNSRTAHDQPIMFILILFSLGFQEPMACTIRGVRGGADRVGEV